MIILVCSPDSEKEDLRASQSPENIRRNPSRQRTLPSKFRDDEPFEGGDVKIDYNSLVHGERATGEKREKEKSKEEKGTKKKAKESRREEKAMNFLMKGDIFFVFWYFLLYHSFPAKQWDE